MHIRCWVGLILWGNDAAELSWTTLAYKVEADVPLTSGIIIPIFIPARWSRSESRSTSDPWVSVLALSCSFNFTCGRRCGNSRWFNNKYTHLLLNKSFGTFLDTHAPHLFFSQGHFSVFPSHFWSRLSQPVCLGLLLLNYPVFTDVWGLTDQSTILQEEE